jgi:hypothetical protein
MRTAGKLLEAYKVKMQQLIYVPKPRARINLSPDWTPGFDSRHELPPRQDHLWGRPSLVSNEEVSFCGILRPEREAPKLIMRRTLPSSRLTRARNDYAQEQLLLSHDPGLNLTEKSSEPEPRGNPFFSDTYANLWPPSLLRCEGKWEMHT